MENQTSLWRTETLLGSNWISVTASPTTIFVGAVITAQFQIPKHVLYGVILMLSILGNAAVVYIILQSRRRIRKTSYVLLVLNLAICDAITPTVSIPIDWIFEEQDHRWTLGAVLCKVLWPLQTMFSTSSALTLAMICYDRYRAVVHPFKARRVTKTHIKHCIFVIHFASCIFVIPYAVVLDLKGNDCDEHWPSPITSYRKAYTLILFLVQYVTPLTLMVTLHSLALKTLRGQSKPLREGSTHSNASESMSSMQFRISARKKMQNIRVTKMFVTVVMVFALSMFPNQVLWLWVDFGNGGENEYFVVISAVCRLFTYSNSVLNPIIYGFYSRELRFGKAKLTSTTSEGRNPGHSLDFSYEEQRSANGMDKAESLNRGLHNRKHKKAIHHKSHCSGFSYAEHRSANEVDKADSVNRGLRDTRRKKAIHHNSNATGEQRILQNFILESITNHPLPLKEDCHQNEAPQGPMNPIENCAIAQNGVLRSPLSPLHNSESSEERQHVSSIPNYTQKHFDNIRESNC